MKTQKIIFFFSFLFLFDLIKFLAPYSSIIVCNHIQAKLYSKIVDHIHNELRAAFRELQFQVAEFHFVPRKVQHLEVKPIAQVDTMELRKKQNSTRGSRTSRRRHLTSTDHLTENTNSVNSNSSITSSTLSPKQHGYVCILKSTFVFEAEPVQYSGIRLVPS